MKTCLKCISNDGYSASSCIDTNAFSGHAVDRKTFKTWSVNYRVIDNWRIEDREDGEP